VPGQERTALKISFNRIKTSMDVRRTKQLGGHLPSAARSNTMAVLFRNYLSGDPIITAWAAEVMAEALDDAEQAAVAALGLGRPAGWTRGPCGAWSGRSCRCGASTGSRLATGRRAPG
jgi:hypothetical protein